MARHQRQKRALRRRQPTATYSKETRITPNGEIRLSIQDARLLAANQGMIQAVSHVIFLLNDAAYFQLVVGYAYQAKAKAQQLYDSTHDGLLAITYAMGAWLMRTTFERYQTSLPCAPEKLTGFWLSNPDKVNNLVTSITQAMPDEWHQRKVLFNPEVNQVYCSQRSDCLIDTVEFDGTKTCAEWVAILLPLALEANFQPEVTDAIMQDPTYFARLTQQANQCLELHS